jgi:hypothetical protein
VGKHPIAHVEQGFGQLIQSLPEDA